jgi:hypothetical protein
MAFSEEIQGSLLVSLTADAAKGRAGRRNNKLRTQEQTILIQK